LQQGIKTAKAACTKKAERPKIRLNQIFTSSFKRLPFIEQRENFGAADAHAVFNELELRHRRLQGHGEQQEFREGAGKVLVGQVPNADILSRRILRANKANWSDDGYPLGLGQVPNADILSSRICEQTERIGQTLDILSRARGTGRANKANWSDDGYPLGLGQHANVLSRGICGQAKRIGQL